MSGTRLVHSQHRHRYQPPRPPRNNLLANQRSLNLGNEPRATLGWKHSTMPNSRFVRVLDVSDFTLMHPLTSLPAYAIGRVFRGLCAVIDARTDGIAKQCPSPRLRAATSACARSALDCCRYDRAAAFGLCPVRRHGIRAVSLRIRAFRTDNASFLLASPTLTKRIMSTRFSAAQHHSDTPRASRLFLSAHPFRCAAATPPRDGLSPTTWTSDVGPQSGILHLGLCLTLSPMAR